MATDPKALERCLDEYDRSIETWHELNAAIRNHLPSILPRSELRIQPIVGRVKSRKSFADKVVEKQYSTMSEVTDISGVRVVAYFEDDIGKIAKEIRKHFDVAEQFCIDKRLKMAANSFGYSALHIAVRRPRPTLPAFEKFGDMITEIQICSVLQHAWAEIEHDLGYKTSQEVPRDIERRFARLASLLELADAEFGRVRDELKLFIQSNNVIHMGPTVEFRIREMEGRCSLSPSGGSSLDLTVEARVVGVANRGIGDWSFDIQLQGERKDAAQGTLSRLRINNGDGSYYTGSPTTSTTGGGIAGIATQYRYLVGLNGAFNGVINTSSGTFVSGPDQSIGLATGSARGANLANAGVLVDDGSGNLQIAPAETVRKALESHFGANGHWVELYRFRYNVADKSRRVINFTLPRTMASLFSEFVPAGSDFAANTTNGGVATSTQSLAISISPG